jgi:tetratricopeptide (TPR) repeat protein
MVPMMMDGIQIGEEYDIYQSDKICVTMQIHNPTNPIVISFSDAGIGDNSFSSRMARKYCINCINISSVTPDWFQYEEMEIVVDAILRRSSQFPKTILYGFSMGGYGALIFSKALHADIVLACSPQAVIGPGAPPDVARWGDQIARIAERYGFPNDDIRSRISLSSDIIVAYDPLHSDCNHVRIIEAIRPIRKLKVPLSGHASLPYLVDLGLGSKLVLDILQDTFSVGEFQRLINLSRRNKNRIIGIMNALRSRHRSISQRLITNFSLFDGYADYKLIRAVALDAARRNLIAELQRLTGKLVRVDDYILSDTVVEDGIKFAVAFKDSQVGAEIAASLTERSACSTVQAEDVIACLVASYYLYMSAGMKERAKLNLESAALRCQRWGRQNALVAQAFQDLGDERRAAMYFRRLSFSAAQEFNVYEQMAREPEKRGNWAEAAAIWAQAVTAKVDVGRAAARHARALVRLNRPREALEALAPALAMQIPTVNVKKLEGTCLNQLGRHAEATEAFRAVVAREPHDAASQSALSNALVAIGSTKEALHHAQIAVALNRTPGNLRHLERLSAIVDSATVEDRTT